LKDKTEQILDAAMRVFINKGFLQATTQEIAKEAEVAEVTLFRKFTTKQNLFEAVITKVLEDKFQTKLLKLAEIDSTDDFFSNILNDRLNVISKNETLVRLLISESIMGNLPEDINFANLIFKSLKSALQMHFSRLRKECDAEFYARQIGSLLLGHAILPSSKPFHKLSSKEKECLISKYIRSLNANL
jgi:AcrR family transcriptional regulator